MTAIDVLLLLAFLALAAVLAIIVLRRPPASTQVREIDVLRETLGDIGALKSSVSTIATAQAAMEQNVTALGAGIRSLETRIVETTGGVKDSLGQDLQAARRVVDELKTQLETRHKIEDDLRNATKRIEAVLAGNRERGEAGENILEEAFRQFPQGMIDYGFKVQGKPVEYALILFNGKRLAIDSKWPAPELLARLAEELEPTVRYEIVERVERIIEAKAREAAKYIDPADTLPWAIAAIPDAVFAVCRKAHSEAFGANVILMPYSMTVPYVLTLFRLHLHYARSVDVENLQNYLDQIGRSIVDLEDSLENKISRGNTMVNNAYNECKRFVGQIREALAYMRALPGQGVVRTFEAPQPQTETRISPEQAAASVREDHFARGQIPKFSRGDKVYIKSLQKVGIVDDDPRCIGSTWMYRVTLSPSKEGSTYAEDALALPSDP